MIGKTLDRYRIESKLGEGGMGVYRAHDTHLDRVVAIKVLPGDRVSDTLLLERAGHVVVLAETGIAAVDAFRREPFDLILMDLQMPEMGGIEATREIRTLEGPNGSHTPIVALTAHAMQGDRERCERASMNGYVTKPIHRDDLFAEIDRLLAISMHRAALDRR